MTGLCLVLAWAYRHLEGYRGCSLELEGEAYCRAGRDVASQTDQAQGDRKSVV